MIRSLQAELLDDLPADHPGASHSRRDLRRLNTLMGHAGILTNSLKKVFPKNPPSRLLEIGAGDGDLLLRVARRLSMNRGSSAPTNSVRGSSRVSPHAVKTRQSISLSQRERAGVRGKEM